MKMKMKTTFFGAPIYKKIFSDRVPLETDDITSGIPVWAYWVYTNTETNNTEIYRCVDNTEDSAKWLVTTLDLEDLGSAAILNIDIDPTLSSNSDELLPTQKAVKTIVDSKISHDLSTAENDFLVGNSTVGSFIKKTLAETKAILSWVLSSTSEAVGFTVSGGTDSKTLTVDEDVTVSHKANKIVPAADKNLAGLTTGTGQLEDSGITPAITANQFTLTGGTGTPKTITIDETKAISAKADKAVPATAKNLAGLVETTGQLEDSLITPAVGADNFTLTGGTSNPKTLTVNETKSLSDKVSHDLSTAENDFLVGAPTPFGTWVKKTLAETKTILAWVLSSTSEAVGFKISGGTTSKTLTVDEDTTVSHKANKAVPATAKNLAGLVNATGQLEDSLITPAVGTDDFALTAGTANQKTLTVDETKALSDKVDKETGKSLVDDTEIAKIHTQNTDTVVRFLKRMGITLF